MKFLVLIRPPDDACREIYSKLGKPLRIGGKPFVLLRCDEFVAGVPLVQVRLLEPPSKQGQQVWLPHSVLVAVYAGGLQPKIGFGNV
jgi:hypothetical protein